MTTMRNSVQLIGRPGKDPEIKQIGNDRKMVHFSLATKHVYTMIKASVETTDWHNIVAFGKVVDIIEKYVRKGQKSPSKAGSPITSVTLKKAISAKPLKCT